MLTTKCDSKGRIHLRESLRSKYGEKFLVIEKDSGVVLVPVPSDPVEDLQLIGRALHGHSLKEIKKRIRRRAKKEVLS